MAEVARVPDRLSHPCSRPGCPNLTTGRFCPEHETEERRRYDQERGSAAARGYDATWRRRRLMFLRRHPLCEDCLARGIIMAATEVDHINGDVTDNCEENYSAKCKPCHSKKTVREQNRWGGKSDGHRREGTQGQP